MGFFRNAKQSFGSIGRLDQNFLVLVMKTEDRTRLLLKQITVHRTWTHHDDLVLKGFPLRQPGFILLFGLGNLVVERDQTKITALPCNQVITEIKAQADPDDDDQVLAENISLFDESLHVS